MSFVTARTPSLRFGASGVFFLQALLLLKNHEVNCAVVIQNSWRKAIARMLTDRLRRLVYLVRGRLVKCVDLENR